MDTITIPAFHCPISPAINPHVETVHRDTIQWTRRVGLVSSDERLQRRLQNAKFAWLAARCQPDASLEELRLYSDWVTWIAVVDDRTEKSPDMQYVRVKHRRLHEILDGADLVDADDPLSYALHDIRQRVKGMTTEFWLRKFSHELQQFFQSTMYEASIRLQGITCNLTTYTNMRRYTVGVYPSLTLAWITRDISQRHDFEFLKHVHVQQLAEMANNYVSWVNDLLGLEKEIKEGITYSLVPVLQKEHDISLQEAINWAVKMCNTEVEAFLDLENRLPSFGDDEDVVLQGYLNVMKTWMRGFMDWSSEDTGRYQGEQLLNINNTEQVRQPS